MATPFGGRQREPLSIVSSIYASENLHGLSATSEKHRPFLDEVSSGKVVPVGSFEDGVSLGDDFSSQIVGKVFRLVFC